MTTVEIPVGTTTGSSVKFVLEGAARPQGVLSLRQMEVEVAVRDWDVTNPDARRDAAIEELGQLEEHHKHHAQWFIDADRNAAALCVFRPEEPARGKATR